MLVTKMMMLIEIDASDDDDDGTWQNGNNVDQDEAAGEGESEPDEDPFEQLSWQASLNHLPNCQHGKTFRANEHWFVWKFSFYLSNILIYPMTLFYDAVKDFQNLSVLMPRPGLTIVGG